MRFWMPRLAFVKREEEAEEAFEWRGRPWVMPALEEVGVDIKEDRVEAKEEDIVAVPACEMSCVR